MRKVTTGIDIINIDRIRNTILKNRDKFYERLFTEREIGYINSVGNSPETVSGMFAAKEAVSKALGTGIGAIGWRDIEILHNQMGKPYVNVSEKLEVRIFELGLEAIEITISHERDIAMALAIGYGEGYELGDLDVHREMNSLLPKREQESHKGDFGRVAIIGGSKGMTGAPYLSSMAALRTGAGLVYTLVPAVLDFIMSIKLTEAIIKPIEDGDKGHFTRESLPQILRSLEDMNVVAIGPGMGADKDRYLLVKELIQKYKGPIVIDADGINCLSYGPEVLMLNNQIVITPHAGEMARLLGKEAYEIEENRIYYSKYISNKYNIVVILKGHNTIVSSPKGEVFINKTGNSGMATAGSGDVLTGIVSSFIAQGLNPFEASKLAVYCHGLAGDMVKLNKGEHGLIATDIVESIPRCIKRIRL
ncbi:MAG: NAD(P)H-hydrate dehydratase [Tissierellaceae bacterium]|nr:NAD(P)H-hydrate dehydratase [Tissierellaceae bacterium]